MNETQFRREFIQLIGDIYRVHKIENSIAPGMPDLLVIRYDQEPIWIELKMERNKLRQSQRLWIRNHPDEIVLVATLIMDWFYIFSQDKSALDWKDIYSCEWKNVSKKEVIELINEQ